MQLSLFTSKSVTETNYAAPASTSLYVADGAGSYRMAQREDILREARRMALEALNTNQTFRCPREIADYLTAFFAGETREKFVVVLLDCHNRLIRTEALFSGSVDVCPVYPREVARFALEHHARSVIISHNHPSGCTEPSNADKAMTRKVQQALELLDIRLLDHIIVGGTDHLSMASRGLL